MNKIELITMGCRLNTYESEVMRAHAHAGGLKQSVIVNSCAVTSEAVRQTRQAARKARRNNPDATIIVTGCAAQTQPEMFAAMPEVDRVLGNREKLEAASFTTAPDQSRVQVSDIMAAGKAQSHTVLNFQGRARAHVQIQNGCDHRCTFCIIPFGRGPSRSVPINDVIDQIKALTENGYKEVVLTGVDITAYGADLANKPGLGTLVQAILTRVPQLPRLRLSSIDSVEVDEALFEAIASEQRLMPHLHLSLQAGDNLTLKRMKRRHSRDDAIDFCNRALSARPDIVFGADIIAGFPTETDEMFENSLSLIDDCNLTHLHIFPFSPRPGTPAALMPQLNSAIIRERARALRTKGGVRLQQHLAASIGTHSAILVESSHIGRTPHFALARLETQQQPGAIIRAEIISQDGRELFARPAS
jgi:threonylcarbamoyladenosine tRNA methylthiotransferase MtaB